MANRDHASGYRKYYAAVLLPFLVSTCQMGPRPLEFTEEVKEELDRAGDEKAAQWFADHFDEAEIVSSDVYQEYVWLSSGMSGSVKLDGKEYSWLYDTETDQMYLGNEEMQKKFEEAAIRIIHDAIPKEYSPENEHLDSLRYPIRLSLYSFDRETGEKSREIKNVFAENVFPYGTEDSAYTELAEEALVCESDQFVEYSADVSKEKDLSGLKISYAFMEAHRGLDLILLDQMNERNTYDTRLTVANSEMDDRDGKKLSDICIYSRKERSDYEIDERLRVRGESISEMTCHEDSCGAFKEDEQLFDPSQIRITDTEEGFWFELPSACEIWLKGIDQNSIEA